MLTLTCTLLLAVGAIQTPAPPAPRTPRALMVFIDGFVPDAIATSNTPTLDRLIRNGAWSMRARAESTTISGSGWSTFHTGVHWDKHGIPDNNFSTPNTTQYPSILLRLREKLPKAVTVSAQSWKPIQEFLVAPAQPTHSGYYDYYQFHLDYFDDRSCDELCVNFLRPLLDREPIDLAVVMFGELDGVGHMDGNRHYHAGDSEYQRMLGMVDERLGRLIASIENRPTYDQEDWLIAITADHSGSQRGGHGLNIPEHREMPMILSGGKIVPGEIWPPPSAADLVPTVLEHLGVTPDPSWGLDGRALAKTVTHKPGAAIGVNLIFNGGGEWDRPFHGFKGQPDASIAGWEDPGWMSLIAYGADEFLEAPKNTEAPVGRGFFAANDTKNGARMEQTIDLTPIKDAFIQGCNFKLSALLGNRGPEGGALRVSVSFLDAKGELLERAELPPLTADQRMGAATMRPAQTLGLVPPDAISAKVTVETPRRGGSHGGFADNLVLVLQD